MTDADKALLLKMAVADKHLGSFIMKKNLNDLVLFHDARKAVGFAIPRKDNDGYWRTGPIYVRPESRGKGIASHFIETFFEDKPGRAWIDPHNIASIKAFTSVGFRKSGKQLYDEGDLLQEYLFMPNPSTESLRYDQEAEKKRLLDLAMNDPYLGPAALKKPETMVLLLEGSGKPVGFIMPMVDHDGRQRTGSIYVEEAYRGKGIAGQFVKEYFKDKAGRAWILPSNRASASTYQGAGFYKTGKQVTVNNKTFDEWINRHNSMRW